MLANSCEIGVSDVILLIAFNNYCTEKLITASVGLACPKNLFRKKSCTAFKLLDKLSKERSC